MKKTYLIHSQAGLAPSRRLIKLGLGLGLVACLGVLMACTPTINLNVKMSPIYAKLDVNVRVQLDEDVKALIAQNPNLF